MSFCDCSTEVNSLVFVYNYLFLLYFGVAGVITYFYQQLSNRHNLAIQHIRTMHRIMDKADYCFSYSEESESGNETGSGTESESESGSGTESETGSETESETGSGTESETGSGTESETGSGTESELDYGPQAKTGPRWEYIEY